MNKKKTISFLLAIMMLISMFYGVGSELKVEAATPTWIEAYEKASFEKISENFELKVGGISVDVVQYYEKASANHYGYSYAHLAYEGTATFEITSKKGNIESVDASPHSYNMNVKIDGNKFSFDLTQQNGRYMVFDVRAGGGSYQLIVAADPKINLEVPVIDGKKVVSAKEGMEGVSGGLNSSGNANAGKENTDKIQKILKKLSENGGGTLYFPAGVYSFVTLTAESNTTIYLDAGAVLRGSGIRTDYDWNTTGANGIQVKERDVRIKNVQNFKIIGKGMIDANSIVVSQEGKTSSGFRDLNNDPQPDTWYPDGWNDYRKGIVDGDNSENIEFKGVTFKDATGWTFNIMRTKNIQISNVKMLDDYTVVHSDGYDIVSCENVDVRNCFGVCGDDVYCPKGDVSGWDMRDYLFKDCVAYAEGGAGCKIGVQARSDVHNITFDNIDVIRGYRGFTVAHDEGEGNWDGIYFKNIRTEKLHIPSFTTQSAKDYGQYTATPFSIWLLSNGSVNNVEVSNCSFESISNMRAILKGRSDNGKLSNVTFKNLVIEGETVTSIDDPRFSYGDYVDKNTFVIENTEVIKHDVTVYEAENAELENGAKASVGDPQERYSNGSKVSNLGNINGNEGSATFTVNVGATGEYDMDVYSVTKGARAFYITVNGQLQKILHCNGDDFKLQGRAVTTVSLNQGDNIIKLGNPIGPAPDLDKIEVSQNFTTQKTADIIKKQPVLLEVDKSLVTLSNGARFNDGVVIGYIGGTANGTVTFDVNAEKEGVHVLQLYYATAENRNIGITVNGQNMITSVTVNNGSWNNLSSIPIEAVVNLNAGKNEIVLSGVNSGEAPNIGKIVISMSSDDAQKTVSAWIDAIPSNATAEDEEYIDAVKRAYDSLVEKDKVTNASKIDDAKKRIADNEAADAVKQQIEAIGTVSPGSEETIQTARNAYDKLTDDQKNLIDNAVVKKLTEAEEELMKLEDKEKSDDKDSQPEGTHPEDAESERTHPEDAEPEGTHPEDAEPKETHPEDSQKEDTRKDQDTVQHEQVNEVETEDETVKNEPEARLQEEANLKPDNPTQGAASNQNITGDIASDQTSVTNAGTQIQSTVSPKEAENIRITGISKKIAAGKKIQLTVKAGFDDTIVDDITWYSSNTNYATVDEDGIVCVKKAGKNKKVIIYATAEDGNKLASYTINIMPNAVKKITITASSKTVKAGNQLKLKASVTPKLSSKKINDTLKWSSNNTKYATVSQKGVVKAKKAGKGKKVKITAKATDGSNKKKTITISIRK